MAIYIYIYRDKVIVAIESEVEMARESRRDEK